MDIKINSDEGKFKFRVCGILNVGSNYLTVKMDENNFYCLPGGHVELGEDTDTAILREMEEELGYKVDIKKLVCVIQNFFKDSSEKCFHEIGFYYVVTPKDKNDVNTENYVRQELDKGQLKNLEFKWFTLEELQAIDFRPKELINKLTSNEFCNIIVKD